MTDIPPLDPDILSVFRCPLTRSPMTQQGTELVAEVGGLRYPINNGIPILLIEEAKLPDGIETLDEFKQKYADQIPD